MSLDQKHEVARPIASISRVPPPRARGRPRKLRISLEHEKSLPVGGAGGGLRASRIRPSGSLAAGRGYAIPGGAGSRARAHPRRCHSRSSRGGSSELSGSPFTTAREAHAGTAIWRVRATPRIRASVVALGTGLRNRPAMRGCRRPATGYRESPAGEARWRSTWLRTAPKVSLLDRRFGLLGKVTTSRGSAAAGVTLRATARCSMEADQADELRTGCGPRRRARCGYLPR